MGGGLGSRTNDESDVRPASADEEALLDEAMQQADEWLVASLQREELRRRRRRRWALGGIAMTITVAAVVTGLILTGGTTPAGVNQSGQPEVVRTAPLTGATDAELYAETSDAAPVAVSESGPPKVVKTVPENGATDVDPDLKFIRVTFNQNMTRGENYSWVGGGPSFPKTRGKPRWVNARTCVLAVQLEPGHDYWLSINSDKFKAFRSVGGVPAEPYPLSFRTAGEPASEEALTGAPKVIEAEPDNGEVNVDPGLTEIRVTFDQDMTTGENYSWTGGGSTFPEMRGKPRWVNARTCVLGVKLKPDHDYWLSVNSEKFQSFRGANGMPAEPYAISFRTGSAVTAAEAAGEVKKPASLEDVRKATGLTAEGWELWRKRQYSQAEAKFEAAVKLDPESTNAWNGLGWSRFNGGDSLGGEEAFKRCLKLDPGHPAAQNGLGQVYFFRRQYDKAREHWLPIAEQAPASWYGLTKTYLLEGDFEKAAKWAKKLVGRPDGQEDVAGRPGERTQPRTAQAHRAARSDAAIARDSEGLAVLQPGRVSAGDERIPKGP